MRKVLSGDVSPGVPEHRSAQLLLGALQPCAHIISVAPQLPEGLDEEPGPLVAGGIQRYPHGVLLQQGRQPLVHRQVLVALHVQELRSKRWGELG